MNFVSSSCFSVRILKNHVFLALFLSILLSIYLVGCGDQVRLPSAERLAEFQNAGPVPPTVDLDRLVRARTGLGPYRVVPGDVLELQIPSVLQVVTAKLPGPPEISKPYLCRVYDEGTIIVPVIGWVQAAGRTLAQIEAVIINAYYPRYSVTRPSVVARVAEYKTARVSITGAVEDPGIYELRTDQMSLVSLIMTAGGIVDDGAARIRIIHPHEASPDNKGPSGCSFKKAIGETRQPVTGDFRQQAIKKADEPEESADENINSSTELNGSDSKRNSISDEALEKEVLELLETVRSLKGQKTAGSGRRKNPESLVLPVKGLNIPFADIALRDGDSVEVERLELPLVTVMGLVNKPGNFPYPPDVQYSLMQALAFAGGFDQAAEPCYTTVYRQKADRTIVSATFKVVNGSKLTDASSLLIKPGDIVAVEHTSRTRTNLFLNRVFRINFGVYAPLRVLDSD